MLENVSGRTLPGAVKVPMAFVPALLKDFEIARSGGPLSLLTSQTLEQVGRFGLHTLPRFVDALKAEGRLPVEFRIAPTTFGVTDLTAGAASHLGRGRLGVDQVTLYLDGISKMTAAAAGMLAGGPRGAKVSESAAGLAQVTLRGLTMPLFQEDFNKPVRQQMEDNWRALQESRIARGQRSNISPRCSGSRDSLSLDLTPAASASSTGTPTGPMLPKAGPGSMSGCRPPSSGRA